MSEVYFYHLTETPLEAALPLLLEKSLERGWKVAVQGPSAERLDFLDGHLWTYRQDSFLPHGRSGGAHDAAQPVLLTQEADHANDPEILMLIDGAETQPADLAGFERVCVLFDGNDETAVGRTRSYWTTLKGADVALRYWYQEAGRWRERALS